MAMRSAATEGFSWKLNKPLLVFTVLVLYIFASFIWWSYLLVRNNGQSLAQSKVVLELQYEVRGLSTKDPSFGEAIQSMDAQYRKQVMMVLGEGLVFLILLAVAIFQIWRSYRTELNLARQQRNFLLSITHELKSPLASIKLAMETLQRRELDTDKRARVIGNSLSDTNRLQVLVDDILLAARFEDHSFAFSSDPISLSELAEEITERVAHNHPHHRFHTDINQNLYVRGDRQGLTSLLVNLLENACKYSPADTSVTVTLEETNKGICLSVADEGIGIPEHEKPHIFRKFYRIGSEDTRKTKGTGLGLFIVKEVADRHQARIKIKNNLPAGTVFHIQFPPVPSQS